MIATDTSEMQEIIHHEGVTIGHETKRPDHMRRQQGILLELQRLTAEEQRRVHHLRRAAMARGDMTAANELQQLNREARSADGAARFLDGVGEVMEAGR